MKFTITLLVFLTVVANLWLWRANRSLQAELRSREDSATIEVSTSARSSKGETIAKMRRLLNTGNITELTRVISRMSLDADQLASLLEEDTDHLSLRERAAFEESLLAELAQLDPERAVRFALEKRSIAAARVAFRAWGESDAEAAFAWFREAEANGLLEPKGALDPVRGYESAIFEGMALNDLPRTLTLLEDVDKNTQRSALFQIAGSFEATGQLPSFAEEITRIEAEAVRNAGISSIVSTLTKSGKIEEALDFVHNVETLDDARRHELQTFVMLNSPIEQIADPHKVADWLAEGSTGSNIGRYVSRWTRHDYNGVSKWLNGRQDQPWYSDVVSGFVREAARVDPESAAEWAATITDAEIREAALETVANALVQEDQAE